MIVAEATGTCWWIVIYGNTYFIDVHLFVGYKPITKTEHLKNVFNFHHRLYFGWSVYLNIQYAVYTREIGSKIFISAKCMCDMEQQFEQTNCKIIIA